MRSIFYQVYNQSETVIPVTIIVALWAAGRGVLSVTSGLNAIYSNIETRNYFYLRIRSTIYTLLFLIAIILSLVISVFGNSISVIVYEHVPFLIKVVDFIMRIRTLVTLIVLIVCQDYIPETASRRGVYCLRLAAAFVCIFYLSGYIYRIFRHVRKYGNAHPYYALALRMYVYHPAGRRGERAAGPLCVAGEKRE